MKSKKQCQNWWADLTPEQQSQYVKKVMVGKGKKRRDYEENHWKQAKIGDLRKYSCRTCFHRKTHSCKALNLLSKICRYWWKPGSVIQGLAYK